MMTERNLMQRNKKTVNLLEGSISRGILAFVMPIMLGTLIQQLYVTTDAIIVGQFAGKEGLASIDAVATLFKFPLNFMNGLAAGATIHISRYFGAGDKDKLKRSVQAACAVAAVLGVVCSVAGVCFSEQLLYLMDVPENIFRETLAYTRIYFAGIWSMILYNMAAGILRAFGDSRSPLYVLILCSICNIAGDYLLVGVFGFGVEGAAAATVASQIISVLCALILLNRSMNGRRPLIGRPLWDGLEYVKAMIVTGFPLALQSMLFPVANSIVQVSVNRMGSDTIAAWGVCNKLDMFIWLVADAMGPALTTYVAQNLGAGQKHRVKKGGGGRYGNVCGDCGCNQPSFVSGSRHHGRLVCFRGGCRNPDSAGCKIYAHDGSFLCVLRSGRGAFRLLLRYGKYSDSDDHNTCNHLSATCGRNLVDSAKI